LKFEKVIDGATIIASGKIISLWGVKAIAPSSPYSWASSLYLETMLKHGILNCAEPGGAGDSQVMRCYIDKADVGSLLVEMGMATAADPYYKGEEAVAQAKQRGVWRLDHGKSL
jgi:endonuclease YncB( thermonuclease family)